MTHQHQNVSTALTNYKKGFRIHLIVFLLAIPAGWIVWAFTDRTYPWPLWQTAGWAIGILFHFLAVYVFKRTN